MKKLCKYFLLINCMILAMSCSSAQKSPEMPNRPPNTVVNLKDSISVWLTNANGSVRLQQQTPLYFDTVNKTNFIIVVDSLQRYQTMDGFGYTLTGGSATLINQLPSTQKTALLKELFGNDNNSIGINYLRISIGASDLNSHVFSYDDMPVGKTDTTLSAFSLGVDTVDLIPVLKAILQINPNIQILGSPWSAPAWMKDNAGTVGGSLLPAYYMVYAKYLAKYIQAMQQQGITMHAITIQNEPLNPNNNPSMVMQSADQANFIQNALGPVFKKENITTKILLYDHNCDRPDYPIAILNNPAAAQYVDGSAFHLYAGNINVLSQVHDAFPNKNVYFTEQWVGAPGDFPSNLTWHVENLIIGAPRNWSKTVLEWNLAADAQYEPHTPGGCTQCLGALTIQDNSITRNVAYYIIAHAAKFVPYGSYRIASNMVNGLPNVAFLTPAGKKVLIVLNTTATTQAFSIQFKNVYASSILASGSVATYVW
ncbi:glycoside hydrolase family 30 protein [Hydrotalea lipotrueae]|uniref:glycoside hydrolase family 30 protein n=1 Tax=Hydrotalea lipotrueae TaxID=2803817 RepID=UPI001C45F30E|nr:glycoside hydrolase family 30 beta sandwich domain-containing protein [Hydrotalea lipotrueae]